MPIASIFVWLLIVITLCMLIPTILKCELEVRPTYGSVWQDFKLLRGQPWVCLSCQECSSPRSLLSEIITSFVGCALGPVLLAP